MKKIIAIGILGMFLLTGFMSSARADITTIQKVEKQNPVYDKPTTHYSLEGNLITTEFRANSYENKLHGTTGDGPDLIFAELRAAWGFCEHAYNCNGIFVVFSIENIGETYYSNFPIKCKIGFFVDDETTPFATLTATPMFDPYTWNSGEVLGFGWFFEREEKPETLTGKIDCTNTIPESNENNNEVTCPVPLSITIEGTVHKRENGELIPLEGVDISCERGSKTDETGHYSIGVVPREPFNEPDTYVLYAFMDDLIVLKTSDPALPGESTTLDFIFSTPPNKPDKPSGRHLLKTNTEYTFSTSATEPEGEQLYYKWYWGDDTFSEWLGPFESGETCKASHTWSKPTIDYINVVARDPGGTISKWSYSLHIVVIKNKAINSPFLNWLENHPNMFPILRQLLGLQ